MSEPPQLLARVAAGDHDAVRACLDRFGNLVWSLARRFTSGHADAEDAAQEIFIELWANAARYDPAKASETTFVAMLARRRLIDRLRKAGRQPDMEDLSVATDVGQADASGDVELRGEAARAARLLGRLKPEQQAVIRASIYEGRTHQEIADALQMPLGTVKTHLRRGLLKLREAMR